jgi:hypothetical protein
MITHLTTAEAENLAELALPPRKTKSKRRARTIRDSEGNKLPLGKLDITLAESVRAVDEQMRKSRKRNNIPKEVDDHDES